MTRLKLIVLLMLASALPARADYTVTISPAANWGAWDGWGVSLCWWANAFGTRDDIADTLFTTKPDVTLTTSVGTAHLPALGLSIVRYNIGGSGTGMKVPPRMPAVHQIASFWVNNNTWDWNADFAQRTMLWKAKRRGVTQFEAFSNSPPWWLCASRSSAGGLKTGAQNLLPENEGRFAAYLAAVVKHARDKWGITFNSVDAFNEPSSAWWNFADGKQEGCTIMPASQARIVADLRRELDTRGLPGVSISASDENTFGGALRTWNSFDDAARACIGRVNAHGYGAQNAAKDKNRGLLFGAAFGAGKKLWMSEYGEADATGLAMADAITRDINLLHPAGWVYWQALDRGGWGLIDANPTARTIGLPNAKFFVLAQFSRHIRPGMTVLSGDDLHTVAAYDRAAHKLVLVTVNAGPAQRITYDLSAFARVNGPVSRWATEPDEHDRHALLQGIAMQGKTVSVWFPAKSVQTLEIENAAP